MSDTFNFSSEQCSLSPELWDAFLPQLAKRRCGADSPLSIAQGSEEYVRLSSLAEEHLRALLSVPSTYQVLFLSGGVEELYAAIPQNLLSEHQCADYIITGVESKNAYLEAKRYGDIAIAASSAGSIPAFSCIPETQRRDFRPDADYVYICYNNAAYGTEFRNVPDTGNIPLVADMSTSFLSEPVDITKFGLVFADLGKSMLPAGMSVVIIRNDLLTEARPYTPSHLNFRSILDGETRGSRPSGFLMYLLESALQQLLDIGGLDEVKRRCERKASLMYDYLDGQSYYTTTTGKKDRSLTNIVFLTGNAHSDERFMQSAAEAGLCHLAGNPAVGGMCISCANYVPAAAIKKLVDFMKSFAFENPKMMF